MSDQRKNDTRGSGALGSGVDWDSHSSQRKNEIVDALKSVVHTNDDTLAKIGRAISEANSPSVRLDFRAGAKNLTEAQFLLEEIISDIFKPTDKG